MKSPRVDVGKIRRQQVIEAAVAVIAEKGLPRLSLSAIEKRAGMSRGQLTYYFRAKEDILMAARRLDERNDVLANRLGDVNALHRLLRATQVVDRDHLLQRLQRMPAVFRVVEARRAPATNVTFARTFVTPWSARSLTENAERPELAAFTVLTFLPAA